MNLFLILLNEFQQKMHKMKGSIGGIYGSPIHFYPLNISHSIDPPFTLHRGQFYEEGWSFLDTLDDPEDDTNTNRPPIFPEPDPRDAVCVFPDAVLPNAHDTPPSPTPAHGNQQVPVSVTPPPKSPGFVPVSYTHLTLPTILLV